MTGYDYKLDYIRSISCILVIVIHIANYYCRAFYDLTSFSYLGAVIFNALSRISVPIFFMISGSVLLHKKYGLKRCYKRVIEKTITLIIITIIYYFWDKYFMGKDINIISLISTPERAMLWFLYAIIGIYIVLPFIKNLVDGMDKNEEKLFVLLWTIFNGIFYLLKIKPSYPVPIISGTYYLGYFVIGHIVYKYKDSFNIKKYNVHLIILFILSMFCIIYFTFKFSLVNQIYYSSLFAYRNLFLMIASVSAFILLYYNVPNKKNKFINHLAKLSFGVYLFHGVFLDLIMKYIPYRQILSFAGIPLFLIIIFIFTYLFVNTIYKVSYIRKFI